MFDFKQQSIASILGAVDSIETSHHKPVKSTPIPDFWDRLPDKIIDPESKKEVLLSQSRIKDFLKVIDKSLCGKRFYHTSIAKDFQDEQSNAMALGTRFEYLVNGSTGKDGGGADPLVTASKGNPTAEEKRARINAEAAKSVLAKFTGKQGFCETQVRLQLKCLDGTLDVMVVGDIVIVIDIKYSGLIGGKEGKWNPLGWPDDIRDKESHIIQATHYTMLARELSGLDVDFYFLVFDSRNGKEGEYKPFLLKISEERINQHKHLILDTLEQMTNMLENRAFAARPTYSGCKKCPIFTCKSRREEPELNVIEL